MFVAVKSFWIESFWIREVDVGPNEVAFGHYKVVVDLDYNRIITSEEIPPIPEPEYSFLRGEVIKLLYPNVIGINKLKAGIYRVFEHYTKFVAKQWGADHDLQLRDKLPCTRD
nr:DENN domain and WD repeat-containing protein SCD1-like isoform X3 [Arachis hypogaea]XP_025619048.1 DENN domain and WD repeat-containing protein SCD1-like isoform X3 [Arachis hypogaea]